MEPELDPIATTTWSNDRDAATWHEAHRGQDRADSRSDSYGRFAALVTPGGLVLDLGCGSGLDAPALASRGLRLVGLDVSAPMLRIARVLPELSGSLLLGEMRALPLAIGSLDGVWADGSLHHLPKGDAACAVQEVARVLRRGGIFAAVEGGSVAGCVTNQEGAGTRTTTLRNCALSSQPRVSTSSTR